MVDAVISCPNNELVKKTKQLVSNQRSIGIDHAGAAGAAGARPGITESCWGG